MRRCREGVGNDEKVSGSEGVGKKFIDLQRGAIVTEKSFSYS